MASKTDTSVNEVGKSPDFDQPQTTVNPTKLVSWFLVVPVFIGLVAVMSVASSYGLFLERDLAQVENDVSLAEDSLRVVEFRESSLRNRDTALRAAREKDRERLEKKGWESAGLLGAQGVYFKVPDKQEPFWEKYCPEEGGCGVLLFRTDSVRRCPSGLYVEANLFAKQLVIGTTAASVKAEMRENATVLMVFTKGPLLKSDTFDATKVECK